MVIYTYIDSCSNEQKQEEFDRAIRIVNYILKGMEHVGSTTKVEIYKGDNSRIIENLPNTFYSWKDVLETELFNDFDHFSFFTNGNELHLVGDCGKICEKENTYKCSKLIIYGI